MLRLQLLPAYVFEGAKVKKAIILCGLIFLLEASGVEAWRRKTVGDLRDMTAQKDQAVSNAGAIKAIEDEIAAEQAAVAPADNKRLYMMALRDYGDEFPKKLRALSPFIYKRVELLSVSITPAGFAMQVRTKTTEDVARMLLNLKQAYEAGLLQPDSLQVTGLTGWPNPTSPLGYGFDEAQHMTLTSPFEIGGLSAVGSNAGAQGVVTAQAGPVGGGGSEGSGESPGEGSEGSGGEYGTAPTAQAGAGSELMLQLARQRYIEPSLDPPPQPYLNLSITARWAEPIVPPGGTAAPAGAPGGEYGYSGEGVGDGAATME